jgi:hypothetical protein
MRKCLILLLALTASIGATGGHMSGGPMPFHHMEEKTLANPALSNGLPNAGTALLRFGCCGSLAVGMV